MAFFEGIKMTGGYGSGPDIITSCSVEVNKGEIVSILGPNGAGKSTAMKAMLGLLKLKSGKVIIDGKDISNLSPQDRVKLGIAFVPQNRNVFAGLTVKENLEMGAFLRDENIQEILDRIYDLFPILKEKKSQLVGELSGGQRQQVALGRALMIKPSVLMLDEPTAGVSPIVMDELFDHILKVKKTNVAVLMVEQNAKQALSISDRGYVLVTGENRYSGTGLWLTISTWSYFCFINLWNFKICLLYCWRLNVFWHNVYNFVYMVFSIFGNKPGFSSNCFNCHTIWNFNYNFLCTFKR